MKKLLLLFLFPILSFGQILSEGFESTTFPPTGWTAEVTNSGFTWNRATTSPLTGTASATILYDPAPADQDESLVSPSFSLASVTSAFVSFDFSMSYYWGVTPNDNYNITVSISTDGGTSWTQIWTETDYGTFSNFVKNSEIVSLASYVGNANCKLKFNYAGNDGAQASLDNIVVSACSPVIDVSASTPTSNSFDVKYNSLATNVNVEYGSLGFTQGTGTIVSAAGSAGTLTVSGLTGNTNYSFYVKSDCQTTWSGPYNYYTLATPNYTTGFDNVADLVGLAGTWGLSNTAGAAQSGTQFISSASSTTAATNRWMFLKGFSLTAGTQLTFTFYTTLSLATGTPHTLKFYYNTSLSTTGVVQIGSSMTVSGNTYTLQTIPWTAPTTGTYYFGFNDNTPIVTTASTLRLDTVSITSPLGVKDFDDISFSVLPNPAKDFVTISSFDNSNINLVELTDINGRVVKTVKFEGNETQINISDLSQGVYMMKINSDKGSVTKKLIKE